MVTRRAASSVVVIGALVLFAAIAGAAGYYLGSNASSGTSAAVPQTFQIQVGAADIANSLAYEVFLPANVTVNAGDTVVFAHSTVEPHTVTFNAPAQLPAPFLPQADGTLLANPQVFFPSSQSIGAGSQPTQPLNAKVNFNGTGFLSTGFLQGTGDVFAITFTKAGSFSYLCMIHPSSMKGKITVNTAGTAYPKTQSGYSSDVANAVTSLESSSLSFVSSLNPPAPTTAQDGSKTFSVYAAAGAGTSGIDYFHFVGGSNLTIRVGDKITWTVQKNDLGVPHTVTFLSGGSEPPLVLVQPQQNGPPKLVFNPKIIMPSPLPPSPYSGTGYFNSGLLVTGTPGPQSFTLTFSAPGVYQYKCVLHDVNGMTGVITVTP